MKTSEFIKKIGEEKILIYRNEKKKKLYMKVFNEAVSSGHAIYIAEVSCIGNLVKLFGICSEEMANLIFEYYLTPLEEREEEKKFIPNLNENILTLVEVNRHHRTEEELKLFNALEKIDDSWYIKLNIEEEVQ